MITVKNLSFKYRTFYNDLFELKNIEFEIKQNEFVILVGKSGSGKSTLAKILAGLYKDYNGSVKIKNEELKKIKDLKDVISISFQFPENQFFLDNVIGELAFGLKIRNYSNEEIIKRIKNVCNIINFPIEKYQCYSPFDLSSGEQRKLGLAIVLLLDTEIIILDEPLCGIDANGRKQFIKIFENLKTKQNKTIIYITHSPEEVFYLTDKIIILDKGEIICFSEKEDLINKKIDDENLYNYLPENFYYVNKYRKEGIKFEKNYYSPKNLVKELIKQNYKNIEKIR
ncbi:MAG TPA: ABC transporter ATP-binding protein [bacterium]|nr:ABC transporter ATP-binding protein [bacterium]HOL47491.1 ABC transporter ATP-binding protein [bacterium]HPQ19587.1 ABC transporter ATP-binding protein [bacterium]